MASRLRRSRQRHEEAELNVISMVDILTVLMFFLMMVFSQLSILELRFPKSSPTPVKTELPLRVEVVVRANRLEVLNRGSTVATLTQHDGQHDLAALRDLLGRLKAGAPDTTQATVLLEADVPYEQMVDVMDAMRGVVEYRNTERVERELFPDITVGDAPVPRSQP